MTDLSELRIERRGGEPYMNSNDRCCAWIVCTLFVCIAAVIVVAMALYTERVKAALAAGYVETTLVSTTSTGWAKP